MNGETTRRGVALLVLQILVSFPIACFCGALVTDILYVASANIMWADFSAWLLAAGIAFGGLAAIAGIVDVIANRRMRSPRQVWPLGLGGLVVLVLALLDNLVHSRDAWTSVMPAGLALSAVTVLLMLLLTWFALTAPLGRTESVPYGGIRR